ncbi:MAPEG family protein [Endozoicomonas sp. Mp262]|uniref:MAPEG family protein n=1 Tax=Endozoicomonas sp. Mp262 TaxID=2919499 RepID=UPI0021DA11CA
MISAIYASLAALLIGWLSFNVIKLRRKHQVSLGDGDVRELKVARAAQANAVEYIPISLLLLFALELNQGAFIVVNLLGIALLAGRVLHARGLLSGSFKKRVLGMKITFGTLFLLSIFNIFYVLYSQLGGL